MDGKVMTECLHVRKHTVNDGVWCCDRCGATFRKMQRGAYIVWLVESE